MRLAITAALLAFSSPALATGGFECRPLGGTGPVLNLVLGHTISPRPISVTLRDGDRTIPTSLGQSWIDGQILWLDLLDPQALRFEGRLRARFQPRMRGRPAIGTLVRGGRSYRMRCIEA